MLTNNLYTESYNNVTAYIEFCGYSLPMPDLPDMSLVNQPDDGKFHHVEIPKDLRQWEPDKKKAFIDAEWHKRMNGEWWLLKISEEAREGLKIPKELIRGNKVLVYLPGWYYFFVNYWRAKSGRADKRPDFRWTQAIIAHWWITKIVMDPKCYGGFAFKGSRRGGWSTLFQCMIYEYASRVRDVHAGMQNVTNDDAKKYSFAPIVDCHRDMIWYFKPINQGTSDNKKELPFKYPEVRITAKNIQEKEELGIYDDDTAQHDALNSLIDYEESKEEAYDKARLERYMLEEPGKCIRMDPVETWKKTKPCLELEQGSRIIGKAIIGSTVEEMDKKSDKGTVDIATVLARMKKMWEESDPAKKNALGKTTNGLKRILIDSVYTGKYDDYGFPLVKENEEIIEIECETLRKQRKWKDLADYRRKFARSIDEILTPSAKKCHFNLAFLQDRYKALMNYKAAGDTRMPVMLKPVWIQKLRTVDVVQTPDANPEEDDILWCSGLPTIEERNKIIDSVSGMMPGNPHKYKIGVDPYQSKRDPDTTEHALSDGAIYVFRAFDSILDGNKIVPNTSFPPYDIEKDPSVTNHPHYLGKDMETNRTVASFTFRYKDPSEFNDMVAKIAIFYGAKVMVESNKSELLENYFENNGLKHYLWKDRKRNVGVYSSTPTITHYFDLLTIHIEHFINNEWHPEVILQWMNMKKEQMTPYDLGVASGMAHILNSEPISVQKKFEGDKMISYYAKRKRVLNFNDFN